MSIVTITTAGSTLQVASPFNPSFPPRARTLGGKWSATTKTWNFDVRDESRVRALCLEIYGSDGSAAVESDLVTLRVTLAEDQMIFGDKGSLYFAGREIARAYGRDSGAKMGDRIVFLQGRAKSGGSTKNWDTRTTDGAIFEIRDLPRAAALKAIADHSGFAAHKFAAIEIVESNDQSSARRQTLEAERAALLARLAEIDAELGASATEQPATTQDQTPATQLTERTAAGLFALLATLTAQGVQTIAQQIQAAARAAAFPGQIELAL